METSPEESARALYEKLGALACLSLGFAALAALLQATTRLPASYTWTDPFLVLKMIARSKGFAAAVLVTYAVGVLAREGLAGCRRALRERAFLAKAALLRSIAVGLLLVLADFLLLGSKRRAYDLGALVLLGFFVSQYRPSRAQLLRQLAFVALGAAIFTLTCYAYTVLKALTFTTDRSYDAALIAFEESLFGEAPHRVIARWAAQHPALVKASDWVYVRVFQHMMLTTVLLVALRKPRERTEYLGALAICYLIGGPLYHLLPAAGPGYVEPEHFPFLSDRQYETARVRTWLANNTHAVLTGKARELETWSYIACMPSLHAAHEFVMLYYARHSRIAFVVSLAFTSFTMLAIVVLGWHYPVDAVGGLLLAFISIRLAHRTRAHLMPRGLVPDDEPVPAPAPELPKDEPRETAGAGASH